MAKYLVLILVLVSFGWAQGEWVVQDNPFNGNDSIVFSDVHAVDSLHVWIYGYHTWGGSWVLKTSDGGKNWNAKGLGYKGTYIKTGSLNEPSVGGIAFVDSLHGWIVAGRYVFSTNDGGENWETNVPEPTFMSYSDVSFIDTLKGWMITSGYITPPYEGRIYHTIDGGTSWQIQDSIISDLRGICFADALKGFVVGDSGTLLRTTDGGTHWTKVETGTTKDLMDAQFADSLHGIVVSREGRNEVLQTTDGGESWNKIEGADGNDVAYPHPNYAWTSSAYFSSDAGSTWTAQSLPNITYFHRNGVSFPDTSHGWIVGDYGRIFHYGPKVGIQEQKEGWKIRKCRLTVLPNPFRQTVTINFQVTTHEIVAIKIYDVQGSLIKSLVNESKPTGIYKIYWDGKNDSGQRIPSGIYFCQLEINGQRVVREKAVLMW